MDSKLFYFRTAKDSAYFLQKQKPAKFGWTQVYRKLNKKGTIETHARRRRKAVKKVQRPVAGLDLAQIQKVRRETPDQRKARNDANLKELRDRRAKAKAATKPKASGGAGVQRAEQKARGTGAKGR